MQLTIDLYLGAKKNCTKLKENINFGKVFTFRMKFSFCVWNVLYLPFGKSHTLLFSLRIHNSFKYPSLYWKLSLRRHLASTWEVWWKICAVLESVLMYVTGVYKNTNTWEHLLMAFSHIERKVVSFSNTI